MKTHFGSFPLSERIERVTDTESFSNRYMAGFLDANGERHIFVSPEDQCFSDSDLKVMRKICNESLLTGFNVLGYDDAILLAMLMSKTPDQVNAISRAIVVERQKIWDATKRFRIPRSHLHFCDLMGMLKTDASKTPSLKVFAQRMGAVNIRETPVDFDLPLPANRLDEVIEYLHSDLDATALLREHPQTQEALKLRVNLSEMYGMNLISSGDAQISEKVINSRYLEEAGGEPKDINALKDKAKSFGSKSFTPQLPPYIVNKSVPLSPSVEKWANTISQSVFRAEYEGDKNKTKQVEGEPLIEIHNVGGLDLALKFGGLHSIEGAGGFESDSEYVLLNADAQSFYPSLMVLNKVAPSAYNRDQFLEILNEIMQKRLEAKRDGNKPVANSLKIVVNSAYGKLKSIYSPFYDPKANLEVTIGGQLTLVSLMTTLSVLESVTFISANTDGILMRVKRSDVEQVKALSADWEKKTGIVLEFEEFAKYFRKDVSNFVAVDSHGNIKSKGIFSVGEDLNKAGGEAIIRKAVVEHVVNGTPIRQFVENATDINDFIASRSYKSDITIGGEKAGRLFRGYKSNAPLSEIESLQIATSLKGKPGIKTEYSGWRYAGQLPSEIPSDLDFDYYANKAFSLYELITSKVNPELNLLARKLEAVNFPIRRTSDHLSANDSTPGKSLGMDYSSVRIGISCSNNKFQVVSEDLLPIYESATRFGEITKNGSTYAYLVNLSAKQLKAKKEAAENNPGSFVLAAKCTAILAGQYGDDWFDFILNEEVAQNTANDALEQISTIDIEAVEIADEIETLEEDFIEVDDNEPTSEELFIMNRETPSTKPLKNVDQSTLDLVDEWFTAIFGNDLKHYPHVCGFSAPPDQLDVMGLSGKAWKGDAWHAMKPIIGHPKGKNTYSCHTLFNNDEFKTPRRQKALAYATYAIMIDDIGTKCADLRDHGFDKGISARVLTSSNGGVANYQDHLFLDKPCYDRHVIEILQDGFVASGLMSDPGHDPGLKGATRLYRLPGKNGTSINNKSTYDASFDVELVSFDPSIRYSVEEIAAILKIDLYGAEYQKRKAMEFGVALGEESLKDNPVYQGLVKAGIAGRRKPSGWIDIECPKEADHTAGKGGCAVLISEGGKWSIKCHHGRHGTIFPSHLVEKLAEQNITIPMPTDKAEVALLEVVDRISHETKELIHGVQVDDRFITAGSDLFEMTMNNAADTSLPDSGVINGQPEKATFDASRLFEGEPVNIFEGITFDPFPMEVLPQAFRDYANDFSAASGFDAGGVAFSLLGSVANMVDHRARIHLSSTWTQPPHGWFAIVDISGGGKSPILNAAMSFARAINKEITEENKLNEKAFKANQDLTDKKKADKEEFIPKRKIVGDSTTEKLGEIASQNPAGLFLFSDELAELIGRMDAYSANGSAGRDSNFFIDAHNGVENRTVDRIGRGSSVIENLSIGVLAGVQPSIFADMFKREKGNGASGFFQRFLCYNLAPKRRGDVTYKVNPRHKAEAQRIFNRIWDLSSGSNPVIVARPAVLPYEAMEDLTNTADDLREVGQGLHQPRFAEHLGKYGGFIGRLCLVLHIIDQAVKGGEYSPDVSMETYNSAKNIMRRLYSHAEDTYSKLDGFKQKALVESIASALLSKEVVKTSFRDLGRSCAEFERLEDDRLKHRILDRLINANWLIEKESERQKVGRPSSATYLVNPKIYDKFKSVAAIFREQRIERKERLDEFVAKLKDGG